MKKINLKKAFTLAEVLITLGIIGTVAAMTIPTLIHYFDKQQREAGVKKAQSVLSQAIAEMANDNGGSIKGTFSNNDGLINNLTSYVKAIKTCSGTPTQVKDCWGYPEAIYNGSPSYDVANNVARSYLVFNDGMSLKVSSSWSNCDSLPANSGWTPNYNVCAAIMVDINGAKTPNRAGKDIFYFWITENNVKPGGSATEATQYLNDCTTASLATGTQGITCATNVIMGISYD